MYKAATTLVALQLSELPVLLTEVPRICSHCVFVRRHLLAVQLQTGWLFFQHPVFDCNLLYILSSRQSSTRLNLDNRDAALSVRKERTFWGS